MYVASYNECCTPKYDYMLIYVSTSSYGFCHKSDTVDPQNSGKSEGILRKSMM